VGGGGVHVCDMGGGGQMSGMCARGSYTSHEGVNRVGGGEGGMLPLLPSSAK
jgi:hypothetical protein